MENSSSPSPQPPLLTAAAWQLVQFSMLLTLAAALVADSVSYARDGSGYRADVLAGSLAIVLGALGLA